MERSRLQDDLLTAFKEEKELITSQIELFDPLATHLRLPVASRTFSRAALISFEILCWFLIAVLGAFCVFRDRLRPFHILAQMRRHPDTSAYSALDVEVLYWSVTGAAVLAAVLLFVIALNLSYIRRKNAILQLAGASIKTVVGQHLKRRASIDAIEQRHFGLPADPVPANGQ